MRESRSRRPGKSAVAALAVAALIGTVAGGAYAASTRSGARDVVVKTADNAELGKTILVTRRGLTIYRLSVERHGKFACTSTACLAAWHPLVVPHGATPAGAKSLATAKRPDGRLQVTYRGGPLYTFANDRRPGDVKGNGLKDVGVWRAVVTGAGTAAGAGAGGTGGGGGGGYGGGGYG
jgi:predicted lipoprotein with Yx(FWY)xxD motif